MRKFAALAAFAAALSFTAPASAMDGKDLATFKAKNACSKCDLKRASISRGQHENANLSRATLRDLDAKEINLRNADLSRSDMRRADFEKADLSGANMSRANAAGADFEKAMLAKANFSQADLAEADMEKADMTGI